MRRHSIEWVKCMTQVKELKKIKSVRFLGIKAAWQKHAKAQYRLGEMYDKGEGTEESKKNAFAWYINSIDRGHTEALYRLGEMYDTGEGVKNKRAHFYGIKKPQSRACEGTV